MSWEDSFKSWAAAPSVTEQHKMDNAESAIRKAINANKQLAQLDIAIIQQGSYRARTNVRQDSDVDICVCLNTIFFPHYPVGKTKEHYGNVDGSISFKDFKNLIHVALLDYFGKEFVTLGNKAFDIHSNTYRVDADVVPAFAYRHYYGEERHHYHQPEGIAFDTNDGNRIINWPHQTYTHSKNKHDLTGRRYRKMVRILKRLRNLMQEQKITAANDIGSFLIESMIWNVPDAFFNHDTYTDDVLAVIAHCFNETLPAGGHEKFVEVNNMKYIFGSHQPCTREKAHSFFAAAWDYLGFK